MENEKESTTETVKTDEKKKVTENAALVNAEMYVTKEQYTKDIDELKKNLNDGFTSINTSIKGNEVKETKDIENDDFPF
jgi:hypothetical protein